MLDQTCWKETWYKKFHTTSYNFLSVALEELMYFVMKELMLIWSPTQLSSIVQLVQKLITKV